MRLILRDRRMWRDFDWSLLLACLTITSIGIVEIYSSTPTQNFWIKQIFALALGLIALLIVVRYDYRRIYNHITHIYIAGIFLLIMVLIFGQEVKGQKNWINLGVLNLQPSEFVKLAVILALAKFLSPLRKGNLPWTDILKATAITALPVALIMLQPDAGTATTFLPILATMLFLSNLDLRLVIISAVAIVALMPLSYVYILKPYVLKPYQIMRIEAIVNPELFEQPEFRRQFGYQTLQSMIAVGSGGITGTGIMKGTQSRLGFLPEHHTDFIGSVLAEETGFVGSIFVLLLYLFIIIRAMSIAEKARDRFGMLVIFGFIAVFAYQIIVNLGMVVGLVPIMGITLPLMSYGGSSILSTMIAVGLIININLHRFAN
ncbi:MAG: rod shape-determining protein RodA [Acidobacteriota bacterium]|nr:rod shape-determining protein RodA [Blastocatellia bacterium]MDW8411407.1 rod shape-determining protein RodA [Acidobacteriota bacterium]